MKKLTIILITATLLLGCDIPLFQKKIAIKGKISQSSKVESSRVRSSENKYTLADAAKVLVFYGNEYDLVEIKDDGTFTGKAPVGSATVLAFLTADNQFIGNLFAGGLNVLPLIGLPDDLSTIDLSSLTLDGTRVIPENNPIGNQIQLTDKEYTFIKNVGAYYEVLAKNIDMDKDGEPDILDGNQILVNSQVYVTVGIFGRNSTAPTLKDTNKFVVDNFIRIEGDKSLYVDGFPIKLEGPEASPYAFIKNEVHLATSCFIAGFQHFKSDPTGPMGSTFLPFEDGVYTFTLSQKNKYTFTHINVDMGNYMVIVIPTAHTNADGYITNFTYEFQLPDGTEIDPRNLLSSYIRIQMNDAKYNQLYEGLHLYGSYDLENYDFYNEKISDKIKLSDVNGIGLAYIDLLGNEYQMNWMSR